MRPQLETVALNIDGRVLAGIRHRDPEADSPEPMLCVHGWLDNANSFLPMMPYLPAFDLVAIDLPGHGHSDTVSTGYSLHEMTYQVYRIMQALEWQSCHLVGHSLGGCINLMVAVAARDCVRTLTLIEASGPMSEPASAVPERLNRALQDRLNPGRYRSRIFADKESAIASRLKAATMEPHSAKLIIDRQLKPVEGGYQWRFDPRWRMSSFQYHTEEQVHALLHATTCPILTVIASDGFLARRDATQARLACIKQHSNLSLAGHHHLHMDTPEPVATAINRFLSAKPALGG